MKEAAIVAHILDVVVTGKGTPLATEYTENLPILTTISSSNLTICHM
jgi:hypothetical protein